MNIHTLINELQRNSIGLSLDTEGRLRISVEKGGLSEQVRNALHSHKDTLVSWLKDQRHDPRVGSPALSRAPVAHSYPLSFAQESLWLYECTHQKSSAYNGAKATIVRNSFDPERFSWAVDQVVARHEAMRTGIELKEGKAVQVVHERPPSAATIIDVAEEYARNPAATQLRVHEEIATEALRKFDFRSPPFMRVRLYRLQENHHILFFCLHHLIYDAQSLRNFSEEIRSFYDHGSKAQVPELPYQYRDFSVWQRRAMTGEHMEALTDFWRRTLSGSESVSLPHDNAPSTRGRGLAARFDLTLDSAETAPLEVRARESGVTAYMLYLAAFYVLLFKHSGRTDLVVGTDVAGREHSQFSRLIGFFVNQIVLRLRFDPAATFRQLLGQVKALTLDAFAHQDMPFSRLVDVLGKSRGAADSPFFSTKFSFDHGSENSAPVWATESLELPGGDAKLEMAWAMRRRAGGVDIMIEYDSALFAERSVANFVSRYRRVLAEVLAHPDKPISLIDLADSEDKALYESRNRGRTASSPAKSFASMLEVSAHRRPQAIAVVQSGRSITYGDLNARSNRLARLLRSKGLQIESRVGICMESGIDYLTSLCALNKIGAAFVPIDSSLPEGRIAQIIGDARLDMLLTQRGRRDNLPSLELNSLQVLCLDESPNAWETLDGTNVPTVMHPDQLAYFVFTSGSTGRPKGVMVTHTGLASLVAAQMEELGANSTSRVLQFASIGFDASIFEIAMALEAGAALYCSPRNRLMPGAPLREFLKENAITHTLLPPTALEVMTPAPLPALTVAMGGEPCKDEIVRRWQSHLRIVNVYGPTETTVIVTMTDLGERDGFYGSIGVPIRGTDAYIVTVDGGLAPIGVPGELCIGGAGVTRGYWQDPRRTADRYIPDAFSGRLGTRLYRTGDLARIRTDGEIQFLGRIDRQVKLRGFRIEPAEIESALLAHPQIRQAVVLVHDQPRELWACVVTADGQLDEASVRSHLRKTLPEYMVPARIFPVDTIPVNVNGKVDTDKVEQMVLPAASVDEDEQPLTAAEARVQAIWREVLNADVGKRQHFFDAGGNSLLLMQVHGRLQREFGVEPELEDLFKYPTIEGLAAFMQATHERLMAKLLDEVEEMEEEQLEALLQP